MTPANIYVKSMHNIPKGMQTDARIDGMTKHTRYLGLNQPIRVGSLEEVI